MDNASKTRNLPVKPAGFDLASLTSLPKDALNQVINRARALINFGPVGDNSVQNGDSHDWMLSGIMRELQSRGLNGMMPLTVVKGLKEYQTLFEPVSNSMDKWLRSLVPEDTERAELMALSRLAAMCLAERIEKRFHAPVCLSTMLRFYIQVPDAIEESFPNYCRNRWIPILLKQRKRAF